MTNCLFFLMYQSQLLTTHTCCLVQYSASIIVLNFIVINLLQVLIKVNLGPIYLGFWVYETTLPELHWVSKLFQQLSNNFFPHKQFACLPWRFETCQVSDISRMLGYKQTIYIKLNIQCMISL